MKTSELINELVENLKCFGDLPVRINDIENIRISWFCPKEDGDFEAIILSSKDNIEVEVIEDKSEKIDKLGIETDEKCNNYYIRDKYSTKCYLTKHSKIIIDKLNETIDKLNGLLEKSD